MIKKKSVGKKNRKDSAKPVTKNLSPIKPKTKDVLVPVEKVTMIQSPKAIEVDVKLFPVLKKRMLKKINELFSPRNRMNHQSR